MEKKGYEETLRKIVNPEVMLAEMPSDKIWLLMGELEDIVDDFEREMAITYLSCNHSEKKHMCTTYLRGKSDAFILEKLAFAKEAMNAEIRKRRGARASQ